MVLTGLPALIGVVATGGLAVGAVASGALTRPAGAVAAVFGVVLVLAGGFPYLALMVLFVAASVLATRFEFEEKRQRNVHEGTHGERGVSNVLAHVVAPTALVVAGAAAPSVLPGASVAFLYTSALAFGAADTFASEFGVLAGKARSILSFRPVPAGTNGGVSSVGEVWAAVGAATTAVTGAALFLAFHGPLPPPAVMLGGATIAGFLGCQVDSVLGELLENRGWLTKGSTNLIAMIATVGIAAGFAGAGGL